ncbi:MarR family transcriptional regulator [Paramagnetospirillum caucaseum]|uniref:MarR family transcriptional regulator n=1 Tax=Paramagnetospirillum caucaseum TaxID=1244869 RepID=M2ZNQ3_9PROT|nr:MarR family transcriptional regulator [Paramagnetospirillum caucaseum]EME68932.1 MarR family transcriptional regulator [Paramagnetospirillum caucaseum]
MADLLADVKDQDALPIYGNPGHLARRLHQIAVSIFLSETEEFGITPVQYAALTVVSAYPGVDQRSLARMIAFDRSTIGDVVIRLEKKGLLDRRAGEDRRIKRLFITKQGMALWERIQEPIGRFERILLEPLAEGEQAIFMYLLHKLVNKNNELSRVPLEM